MHIDIDFCHNYHQTQSIPPIIIYTWMYCWREINFLPPAYKERPQKKHSQMKTRRLFSTVQLSRGHLKLVALREGGFLRTQNEKMVLFPLFTPQKAVCPLTVLFPLFHFHLTSQKAMTMSLSLISMWLFGEHTVGKKHCLLVVSPQKATLLQKPPIRGDPSPQGLNVKAKKDLSPTWLVDRWKFFGWISVGITTLFFFSSRIGVFLDSGVVCCW